MRWLAKINGVVSNIPIGKTSGDKTSTDSDVEAVAQSDIVEGLKVRLPPNSGNMAELGVSPRETRGLDQPDLIE